jgi:type 1 fimbriae regulatory protein FimB/type 1 fimbriae regulatory protein FimE
MNTVIQLRPSRSEKPTVRGGRAKNADYRQREYLTEAEIEKLLGSAGESRNPVRDRLLIPMAFRHALRVSELVDIRWQRIHLDTATIDIRRAKNGTPGIHGLQGDELRLLRALRREHPHADSVFLSERKAPLSVDGAQKLIERLGEAAKLPFPIHAICCGMLLATPWRHAESIQGHCRPSWAIGQSRTPLSTPRSLTSGSATSGAGESIADGLNEHGIRPPATAIGLRCRCSAIGEDLRMTTEEARWHWGEGNKYSLEAMKALLLLNGGGAIALLTFIGNSKISIGESHQIVEAVSRSLISFGFGVVCAVLIYVTAYETNLQYGNQALEYEAHFRISSRSAVRWHWATRVLLLLAVVGFIVGIWFARDAVVASLRVAKCTP